LSTFGALAELPLAVESYALEGLALDTGGWTRLTTLVRLRGGGREGIGEDVVYSADEQRAFAAAGPVLALAGSSTLAAFSRRLDELPLGPADPDQDAYRAYRRWAFESAALDLALRQSGLSLAAALERAPRPVRFAVSTSTPRADWSPLVRIRAAHPGIAFKLDADSSWGAAPLESLARLGGVAVVDLKGAYVGTPVDQPPDAELYRRVAEALPDAWIEDPALTPATRAALAPHAERITWDAPIHAWSDVLALEREPRALNCKPSRIGTLEKLCELYDRAAERGIALYGGGQFELGAGRGQIQLLASLFHPDAPNDVAPGGYNAGADPARLPASPLAPAPEPQGFGWRGGGA
jgi:hypothetical protein